jgi:photosystem II stability/assembly factor-like uncharacterized protein
LRRNLTKLKMRLLKSRRAHGVLVALLLLVPALSNGFTDPLDQPARMSPLVARNLLMAVARAGERLVAVGQRGAVVYSDDKGANWAQARVPVSSDLTAVWFVDAHQGWSVGHDGVILHSSDAGQTWEKQLDGRQANAMLVSDLESKLAAQPDDKRLSVLLSEAKRNVDAGPDKPFMDVWFSDPNNGFAVGAYNLIFRTRDGGAHWEPWYDRTENPNFMHLYAVRGVGQQVYVAGERGLFMKLDMGLQRFVARPMTYQGSLFAMAAAPGYVTVFGMRGNALRTTDEGQSWRKVDTGVQSGLSGASVLEDGRVVAVSQAGQVLVSQDKGASFVMVKGIQPMVFAGVVGAGTGHVAVAGTQGVRVVTIP